ncbi:phosphoglycerate mutase-like protein [Auriculariales sp. MPI-PUGE-AT-0066]|nr:phosphoglycerate mutase-like protein [Auriculariales sp. MPI-PUGE-AT-0066]
MKTFRVTTAACAALLFSPTVAATVLAQQQQQDGAQLPLSVPQQPATSTHAAPAAISAAFTPGHQGQGDDYDADDDQYDGEELEDGDDFAMDSSNAVKWRSKKNAGRPKRVKYPPKHLNETFDPAKAFPTPDFRGPSKPGDERLAAEDAYPPPINVAGIAHVMTRDNKKSFDALAAWGNLSPYNNLPEDVHGVYASPAIPDGCNIAQIHVLHRHGARFPEENDPPTEFAERLHKTVKKGKGFTARGELEFLNTWRYPLGEETLVPLGRAQLFNLGVSMRMKYGALLKDYKHQLPVFRTTSQHRMLHSALNFAAGFFGIPFEEQYHQLVIIEADKYNNTLAPHKICPGGRRAGKSAIRTWQNIFLKEARERLALQIDGYDLKIKDVFAMLQTCAYETVALGYSQFCELFTAEEHRGLGYAADLRFHAGSFGSRVGPANGIGWTRELLARLDAMVEGKSAHVSNYADLKQNGWKWGLNTSLVGDSVTFPLTGSIYVDATHDTVIAGVLAALNISDLHRFERLPRRRIPRTDKRFHSAKLVPFGANLVGQVIKCHNGETARSDENSHSTKSVHSYIRWVLNDAIIPLRGSGDCPSSTLGLCPLGTFMKAIRQRLREVNFIDLCQLHPDEDGGDEDTPDPEDPPERTLATRSHPRSLSSDYEHLAGDSA